MKYFPPFRRSQPHAPEPDLLTDLSQRAAELRAERFRVDFRISNDSERRSQLDLQIAALDSALGVLNSGTGKPESDGVFTLLRPVDSEWEVPLEGLLDQLDLADGRAGDSGGDHLSTDLQAAPEGALPDPEQARAGLRPEKKRLTLPRVNDTIEPPATPTESSDA